MQRSIERTAKVSDTIVVLDDGSDDGTFEATLSGIGPHREVRQGAGWAQYDAMPSRRGATQPFTTLYYLWSPFDAASVASERVHEIRDKEFLWAFVKAYVEGHRWVLCLDGDEWLSQHALHGFFRALEAAEKRPAHVLVLPFIYLWDTPEHRRVDHLYGDDATQRSHDDQIVSVLRFQRLFTTGHLTPQQRFGVHFEWISKAGGGFHCGSVPRAGLIPEGERMLIVDLPVVHAGYLHAADRERKYQWYNAIDPNNDFEGRYEHVRGHPDRWCPGAVQIVPYKDH